jgi:hypothetical protein
MDETFEIPVLYRGQELLFPARLLILGYVHKFQVTVEGRDYFFETDNNGEYRALIDPDNKEGVKKLDTELFKAIAEAIASILH